MKSILVVLFLFTGNTFAALTTVSVEPSLTAAGINQVKGPNMAYWDPAVKANGKLLITIGGTTSRPVDIHEFAAVAVQQGYRVVSVDYFNLVITTACRDLNVTDCFDQFREEIVLGNPVSDLLDVDRQNSLENRLRMFMNYLASQDAQWNEFFKNGEIVWEKSVLMGNSQGAGHAAYLSKLHDVAGVLLVIGPQDHFKDRPAPWVLRPGLTHGDRYFSFLHRDDYFDSNLQIAIFKDLCGCSDMSRVILTSRPVQDTHNSLLTPMFTAEWIELLRMPLDRVHAVN